MINGFGVFRRLLVLLLLRYSWLDVCFVFHYGSFYHVLSFFAIALVAHAVKMQQLPVTVFVSIITVNVTLMPLQLLHDVSEQEREQK